MNKKDKDLQETLGSLLGEDTPREERPRKRKGMPTMFYLPTELHDKLKSLAYWERISIKEVGNEAIREYISKYEKKNGEILPIPKR